MGGGGGGGDRGIGGGVGGGGGELGGEKVDKVKVYFGYKVVNGLFFYLWVLEFFCGLGDMDLLFINDFNFRVVCCVGFEFLLVIDVLVLKFRRVYDRISF